MPDRDVKILFVGDMHLGRLPARVPDAGPGGELPPVVELGPGAAWLRAAEEAVRLQVDAVALAGDVVHGANDYFEGAAELDEGLLRLEEAGIAVVAVAGNHDTLLLPRLAARRGFHLLGAGGTWSAFTIERASLPAVRLVGWSFPEPRWGQSPLAVPPPPREDGVITLGLLHADLDAGASEYAPVGRAALVALGYDGWFLGHVHRPDPEPRDASPFYLGSLTGLDPTETGRHGPVLVSIAADGSLTHRRLALAPLRWEQLELDLTHTEAAAAQLVPLVHAALEDLAAELTAELAETRALGVRLRLCGQAADPTAVARAAETLRDKLRPLNTGGTTVFVDRVDVDVHARRDYAALARRDDPAGLLARRILVLDGADDVPRVDDAPQLRRRLVQEAHARLVAVDRQAAFRNIAPSLDDEGARRLALVTARDLLEHLLNTRGGERAAATS